MIFDVSFVPFLRNPMLYSQFMPPTIVSSITNTLVITEIMSTAMHHLWNKRNCPIHRTIHIAYLSNMFFGNCLCWRQYLRIHYPIPPFQQLSQPTTQNIVVSFQVYIVLHYFWDIIVPSRISTMSQMQG
jgi:hypothetical protein